MDERQALTQEMVLRALMNSNSENTDLLQLMASVLEDIENGVKKANEGILLVKQDTENIAEKIDVSGTTYL